MCWEKWEKTFKQFDTNMRLNRIIIETNAMIRFTHNPSTGVSLTHSTHKKNLPFKNDATWNEITCDQFEL